MTVPRRPWTSASWLLALAVAASGCGQSQAVAPTGDAEPAVDTGPSPGGSDAAVAQTIGGGTTSDPAQGPPPAWPVGGPGFVLVKNWDFGRAGTITDYADLDANFQYHDQFGTISNGGNYGAVTVAHTAATAVADQPVEDPAHPVRAFTSDALETYLVPLDASGTVTATAHNLGNGSLVAQWGLPAGGSRLGHDVLWETRVRYVVPPYFWFALWTSGAQWDAGAEFDVVESFGYDNGGGNTNFDGRYWHANAVPSRNERYAYASWSADMQQAGFATYDATQWHTWSLLYRTDDSYAFYCDGVVVQSGSHYDWTLHADASGTPLDIRFLFDAGWGHTQVASVNKSLPASAFDGKLYAWDYSRVYLR